MLRNIGKTIVILAVWVGVYLCAFGAWTISGNVAESNTVHVTQTDVRVVKDAVAYANGNMALGMVNEKPVYLWGVWRAGQTVPAYLTSVVTATNPTTDVTATQDFYSIHDPYTRSADDTRLFITTLVGLFAVALGTILTILVAAKL